jgi:hypothetical protein
MEPDRSGLMTGTPTGFVKIACDILELLSKVKALNGRPFQWGLTRASATADLQDTGIRDTRNPLNRTRRTLDKARFLNTLVDP